MFKATIEFKDNTQITIENKREFMKFYFDRFADKLSERDFGNMASIIYGGIFIDYDMEYVKQLFKVYKVGSISVITFEGYQIKKQHQDVKVFTLDKDALNNFMSMIGVKDRAVHAGATYYSDSFVWEVNKVTIVL